MAITVYRTHIEVYPYKKDDCPLIEDIYTAIDNFTKEPIPCGYFIEDSTLYLPRGTSISKLEQLLGEHAIRSKDPDPWENMSRQHYCFHDLRDNVQEKSVAFLTSTGDYVNSVNSYQKAFSISTGVGKTVCSVYAFTQLNIKSLIITHKDGIKKQWERTLRNMFDYKANEILDISGSDIMDKIMNDEIDPADVYLVNHQTLHSYLARHTPHMLHEFFRKIKIGIKIYDEAHLEFNNILMMDALSDTAYTWYVTATFARSDKSENRCFKNAFSTVEQFGSEFKSMGRKHVHYFQVPVYSQLTWQQLKKVNSWNGMSSNSYSQFAFNGDKNETVYKALKQVVESIKNLNGKKLIFVGLIQAANDITDKLKRDFPECSIGTYHSQISKDEKEDALKKDFIITTIKSCGVGTDIRGSRFLINCEAFASRVLAEQLIGRLREIDKDTDTYMYDITIMDIPAATWWLRARSKKLIELALSYTVLDLTK